MNDNGIKEFIYPLELTKHEIDDIGCSDGIYYVYGKIPLMITKQLPKDLGYKVKNNVELRDRKGIKFGMKTLDEDSYSVIYNSVPHYLADLKELKREKHTDRFYFRNQKRGYKHLGGYIN